MTFLDGLLEGGSGYRLERGADRATLRPANDSDAALEIFQRTAERVRRHEGEGYVIHILHEDSDRPGGLIDRIVLDIG